MMSDLQTPLNLNEKNAALYRNDSALQSQLSAAFTSAMQS